MAKKKKEKAKKDKDKKKAKKKAKKGKKKKQTYLKKHGCRVKLKAPTKAIHIWNTARGKVIGLFHVTCYRLFPADINIEGNPAKSAGLPFIFGKSSGEYFLIPDSYDDIQQKN